MLLLFIGQTLKVVALNLKQPCFSHGQLYVACSRTGDPEKLYILTEDGDNKTKNVVAKQALEEDLN